MTRARILAILLALASAPLLAQQDYPHYGQYAQPAYQPGDHQPQPQYAQPYAPQQQPYQNPLEEYPQQDDQQAQPLSAEQIQQLVAPIALYPDALLAQMLAASTYPAQVAAADEWLNWMQAQGYNSPEQVVAGVDAQTGWDPSVKALTAFPQVLAQMDRNLDWTTNLGNAYYNQPQDVMQTIQVMRQRAENAGTLQSTPQEDVDDSQGYVGIAPANPQVVYVPQYNPWGVYGQPIQPYPGFSPLSALGSFFGSSPVRYGLGIGMSAFTHTSWGWMGWGLNWLTNSVLFQYSNYSIHSTSVADRGFRRGAPRASNGYGRPAESFNGRGYRSSGPVYSRPSLPPQLAYSRVPQPSRPEQYGNEGYRGGYYNRPLDNRATRPGMAYAAPNQPYRAPVSNYSREEMGGRQYGGREFAPKESHSGGFHPFGGERMPKSYGGHEPKNFGKEKAPKASHSGGGHSGGGHKGFFHSH